MDTQLFQHAIELRDAGRLEEAALLFLKMFKVTADPEERTALLLNQSTCLINLGRFRDARKRLSEARRLLTRNSILHARVDFAEATMHWGQGNCRKALRELETLFKNFGVALRDGDHRDLYEAIQVKRGTGLALLGRHRESLAILEEALDFDLEEADKGGVLFSLGVVYFNASEATKAKEAFLRALELKTCEVSATRAHYFLGIIYSREQQHARALSEFQACVPGAEKAEIGNDKLYGWLAREARLLGLISEAERYEKLAKG